MLFVFVGILFFLSPKAYAHAGMQGLTGGIAARRAKTITLLTPTITVALPTPTDTPIIPTPTNTPIVPTPTDTPIPPTPTATPIVPTPTDTPTPPPTSTPVPTATATTAPTNTPTVPRITPTPIVKPTSTSAAGFPPGGKTQQTTPTPTPSRPTVTGTPSSAGLPPGTTDVVASPTTATNTVLGGATITAQNNGNILLPSVPEIAIGSSVVGAATLMGWYVWRRRQGGLLSAEHTAQSLQSSMPYAQPTQTGGGIGTVRENGSHYQQGWMVPETPLSQHIPMGDADTSLETIMRQAQMGLFALPNKEEYS